MLYVKIWNLQVRWNKVFDLSMKLFLTVFNQKTLYNAYKKRTKNVEVDLEEYNRLKEADPEFYRDASSLQYGKVWFCWENLLFGRFGQNQVS